MTDLSEYKAQLDATRREAERRLELMAFIETTQEKINGDGWSASAVLAKGQLSLVITLDGDQGADAFPDSYMISPPAAHKSGDWSTYENLQLERMIDEGVSEEEMATRLGRSVGSIAKKISWRARKRSENPAGNVPLSEKLDELGFDGPWSPETDALIVAASLSEEGLEGVAAEIALPFGQVENRWDTLRKLAPAGELFSELERRWVNWKRAA